MLLVRTIVRPSDIEGLGLFADEDIKKGTITWRYEPRLDLAIDREVMATLPDTARAYLKRYGYFAKDTGKYILPFDNDRYSNHSDLPNTHVSDRESDFGECAVVAARDIMKGEEMTIDYRLIDYDIEEKGVLADNVV